MEVTPRPQTNGRTRAFFGRTNGTSQQSEGVDQDAQESRPRRKVQKPAPQPEEPSPFRKPSIPASAMKNGVEIKTAYVQRHASVGRESKPLHGPRPLQTTGKRILSEGMKPDFSRGTFLPPSSSMPVLDLSPAHHALDSSPSKQARRSDSLQSSQSFAFLPAVNFDDFQSSIASYESSLDKGFAPFSATNRLSTRTSMDPLPTSIPAHQSNQSNSSSLRNPSAQPRLPLSETLASRRQLASPTKSTSSATSDAYSSSRARRQTTLPGTLSNSSATPRLANFKLPRKSVGPGVLINTSSERQKGEDESQAAGRPVLPRASPTGERARARTLTSQPKVTVPIEQTRATAPTQSSKAKTISQPSRQRNEVQYQETTTPGDSQRRARSSSRPAAGRQHLRATTPSSGNNRQSGRISGLGARTISPTDARRLKRMSMMPQQSTMANSSPAIPKLNTMPQLHAMQDVRSTARSPSMIPRKTTRTPSSARETPDSNAHYYTSTSSLSRSSSHQSLKAGNSTAIPRAARSPSSSRLPTPRARNVYSSADTPDDEEIVPPVPAIPKAYESPHEQIESPFFSTFNSTQHDHTPTSTVRQSEQLQTQQPHLSSGRAFALPRKPPANSDYHHFSRPSVSQTGSAVEEPKSNAAGPSVLKKKTLQPIRLPPLSLQPLSTPTAARIAALPYPSQELDERDNTPPPKRNLAKTPSTPMTASKAAQPLHRRLEEETRPTFALRSSTSHHGTRGIDDHTSSFDAFVSSEPVPIASHAKRQVTPFTSGSLPKNDAKFMPYEKLSPDDFSLGNAGTHPQNSKPQGPRARATSNVTKQSQASLGSGSNEGLQGSPRSGSLRRKFSLKWKKSSDKQTDDADPFSEQADKSKMPPPALPAAASWQNKLDSPAKKTPTDSPRSSFDTARLIPSQATSSSANTIESAPKMDPQLAGARLAFRPMHSHTVPQSSLTPRSSSWSVSGQSKAGSPTVKAIPQAQSSLRLPTGMPSKDKHDTAADEEMRLLSLKKKEVDIAAKLTEELQRHASPKQRMTPSQAIQSSAGVLNIYEKGEIIDYKDGVWFCGTRTAKKHVGDISAAGSSNFGYDDERGDYNICLGDHLAYRFEVVDLLGKGSFGQVLRCIDHKEGCLVAIKIIRNKKRFHQQALVEVNILNKLKEWDPHGAHSSLSVVSSFYFRSHLCIVTPCLSINLYELIKEHSFQGFSLQLIRRFARQLLSCLALLQSKRIIHCDLKPENILLCDRRRADIRVIDFGSSCKSDEKVYTYIQSRFYRSPEVILGSEYSLGIDMWSTGCILAELYTGYPIFPGENEQEQLACIMEIFGPPSRDIIEKSTRRKLFFDSTLKPRVTVSSKGRRRRPSSKTLNMALKCDDEAFLDFLTLCLRWDPERRLRPDQALNHPFVTGELLRQNSLERPRPRPAATQSRTQSTTGGIPSPTKRTIPSATAPVSGIPAQTPARARPLPQTPSAAVRGASTAAASLKASPVKPAVAAARRQSSIMSDGSSTTSLPALANKRPTEGGSQLPRMSSGRLPMAGAHSTNDLAGAAARESMGLKWR